MNSDNKLEKILNETLELYEKGKSISEIFNLFPEYKNELQEIFQVIEVLAKEKETILPSQEILSQILNKIPEPVTKFETNRYLYRGEKLKGRPSIITLIKNQYTMTKNWKVIVPLGVIALVAVVMIVTQLGGKPREITGPAPATEQPPVAELPIAPVAKPPVATGNVDDVVNALFVDSSDEVSQISKAMDDDVALVGLDSQAISDFGQSYNENDF